MFIDSELSRRDFLKAEARTGSGLATVSGMAVLGRSGRVVGANDRVQIAVVGLHGQGFAHVQEYAKLPDVAIAAVCDVDENVLAEALAKVEKMGISKPKTYIDYRKLLDDKSIDAVSIATPNHWHSLMGIWACQAGKDAYVEKPCSHNLWEGRQLVRAATKYSRIVQHGTNNRSSPGIMDGIQKLRGGLIGEIYMGRGLCFKWRDTIGKAPVEPVPPGVHYDLWTGPAPLKPFTRNRFHYNWHWFWDTGNGDLGNQGIHEMDLARWGLGVEFPRKVSAIGGHFLFDDDQETPNTINAAFEFDLPNGKRRILEFEVRHWMTNGEAELGTPTFVTVPPGGAPPAPAKAISTYFIGDIFYGSKGYLAVDDNADSYKSWLGKDAAPGAHMTQGGNNWANFIECVRSRKQENLNAPIHEGHISCALVHLANASYRLGRTLHFDPDTQQVIGDDEANRMLRGSYRDPYVVPENV